MNQRTEILRARRACNKALKLAGPLVGGAGEINAVLFGLGKALKDAPKVVRVDRRPSLKTLIRKADDIYSLYIRLTYADAEGFVACFTCGRFHKWNDIDNGHFIKRQYEVLRYHDKNCHPQCTHCNNFLQGNDVVYAERIKAKYGGNILLWLQAGKRYKKYQRFELEALIRHYEAEVKKLEWKRK